MRGSTLAAVTIGGALAASGCTRYVVRVDSEPAGAQVLLNGSANKDNRWSVAPDHAAALQARWPDGKTLAATVIIERDARVILRRDGDPDQIVGARVVGMVPTPTAAVPPAVDPPAPPPAVKPGPTDPMAQARVLYDQGQKAYELTDYDVAIDKFKAAYELIRSSDDPAAPEILGNVIFNLAVVYERSYEVVPDVERLRRARVMYRQYDEQMTAIVPAWATSAEHTDVLGRIRALEARLGPAK